MKLVKKLSSPELNELTKAHPMLKEPPLEEYFHKVKSLTPTGVFLDHIVRGEKEAAEAMLNAAENSPDLLKALLCETAQVTDYSSRTIEGTALQLAWGADDVSREAFSDEGMADMLMMHLRKLLGKAADIEINKQYDAQFPADYEQEERARNEKDLAALNKVFAAVEEAEVKITNDKIFLDEKSQKAIEEFKEYLAPKGVIKTGKHFNVNLLIEALKLFEKKTINFDNGYDSPRNMFFWQQVIWPIQCLLPACYAQAFCQSLCDVVDKNGKKLERSLEFRYGGYFFPINSEPSFCSGIEWAFIRDGVGWGGPTCAALLCKTYIEQKQKHYMSLRRDDPETTKLSVGRSSA